MSRFISIFLLLISCFLINCNSYKSALSHLWVSQYEGKSIIAWYEDTSRAYYIALTKEKKFFYTIVEKDSSAKSERYYKGKFRFHEDTIFLTYHKGGHPNEITRYLMLEGSGNYLIQPSIKDNRRLFLRLMRSRIVI